MYPVPLEIRGRCVGQTVQQELIGARPGAVTRETVTEAIAILD